MAGSVFFCRALLIGRVFGGAGADTIAGGPGVAVGSRRFGDRLHGGEDNDTVDGRDGRDLICGGRGDDNSFGGDGPDLIFANRGRDRSAGGDGGDVLWALARADVTALGDMLGDRWQRGRHLPRARRGGGSRRLQSRNERVIADQFDIVADATATDLNGSCEVVNRTVLTQVRGGEDSQESGTESPSEDTRQR